MTRGRTPLGTAQNQDWISIFNVLYMHDTAVGLFRPTLWSEASPRSKYGNGSRGNAHAIVFYVSV